jgi:aspartyl protease family protein
VILAGWIALGLLVAAALAIVLRSDAGTVVGLPAVDLAAGAASIAVLIVVIAPLHRRYEGRWHLAFRDTLLWGCVSLGLACLYTYRHRLPDIASNLFDQWAPSDIVLSVPAPVEGERLVRLRRAPTGHFVAHAEINGAPVNVVIDTGATTVVLVSADAERAGIDLSNLTYSVPVTTANGSAFAAPVRIKSLFVGQVGLSGVEALVAKPGTIEESLLGMSFLSRLKSYEFSGEFLTLRG